MATDQLSSTRINVDGRAATYGAGGVGPPVVFLHGWAFGNRAQVHGNRGVGARNDQRQDGAHVFLINGNCCAADLARHLSRR